LHASLEGHSVLWRGTSNRLLDLASLTKVATEPRLTFVQLEVIVPAIPEDGHPKRLSAWPNHRLHAVLFLSQDWETTLLSLHAGRKDRNDISNRQTSIELLSQGLADKLRREPKSVAGVPVSPLIPARESHFNLPFR
jgi:hypothetical protein